MSEDGKIKRLQKAVQLKIVLKDSKPPIWRRVLVKNDISFHELHHTIQIAMGWEEAHLYEFSVDNYRIGAPNEEFDDFYGPEKLIDAKEIRLNEVLSKEMNRFSYLYDFGDYWEHDIIVEKTLPLKKGTEYPICIAGKMNCPPEDCGGIPGFYHFMEIMKDKKHPEHKEMVAWHGGVFNPTEFDIQDTNLYLDGLSEELILEERLEGTYEDDYPLDEEMADEFLEGKMEDLLDIFAELPVKVVNKSKHPLPEYESEGSAGMDLRANLDKPVTLKPLERTIVKTGLFIELPLYFEAQVRPRSGLAAKHGITVLNAPGTIDADYRGEIGVILVNLSNDAFTIENGDRIAQMVIARHERIIWEEVNKLGETDRGEGGFGSTGV